MQEQIKLETPGDGFLFSLKDITYSPVSPRMNEPFTVSGTVELLNMPFLLPVWVIITVEYPEKWWEEIIPIIGAPQVREMAMVVGGKFETTFTRGFTREGVFKLTVRAYAGPTMPIDKMTLPPFPPVTTEETTFIVAGEVPPEEEVWNLVEEISGLTANPGPPIAAWELVEEVSGLVVNPSVPIEVWELVEEISGLVVNPSVPVAAWELVEEISGLIVTPTVIGYTKIIDAYVTPSKPTAGQSATVVVYLKNTSTQSLRLTVTGVINGVETDFGQEFIWIGAGVTSSWTQPFTMPQDGVTIRVWSWYLGVDGIYHKDDEKVITV